MYEGAVKPSSIEQTEHLEVNGVPAKRVLMAGYDGANLQDVLVDAQGRLMTGQATLPGLSIPPFTAYYIAHTTSYVDDITYYDGATLVATVTATYADTAKQDLISAVKT
jgi:hypothetical protein